MKKFALLLVLLFTSVVNAQENDNTPVEYSEVITVDGSNAKDLYSKAKLWLAQNYKDATKITKLDDTSNYTLLAKPLMRFTSNIFIGSGAREGWISYDLEIICKDWICK